MHFPRSSALGTLCLAAVLLGSLTKASSAEELTRPEGIPDAQPTTANKPVLNADVAEVLKHPLLAVIRFARAEQAYLQKHVQSISCRLIKRERIDGVLQENQFVDLELQEEIRRGDEILRPFRVFLTFLEPREVKGRKVLFVAGENNGKMLVRKGGTRFNYAIVRITPLSDNAKKESLIPINEVGFGQLLHRQIAILEQHLQVDPEATNTRVEHITGALINERDCEVIRIVHPTKQPGLEFHEAHVYIDQQLHVPVRIDFSDWPEQPGGDPLLIAEYTYTNVRLNVNFPESTFDEPRLKQ